VSWPSLQQVSAFYSEGEAKRNLLGGAVSGNSTHKFKVTGI
jgi:hypothetical protein